MSAAAVRNSSRRRTPRAAATAASAVVGAPDGGQDLLLQVGAVARLEAAVAVAVAEQRHRLRGPQQQVGGEPPGGQDPGQVLGGGALVAQQPQVPGRLAERVGDLAEAEQPGVRVGGVGEPAEQHGQQGPLDGGLAGHPGGQRLQVAQRGGRVGVAEGLQPLPRPPPALSRVSPGASWATASSSGR